MGGKVEKVERLGQNQEKRGGKRKGLFTLPLLTGRAGCATVLNYRNLYSNFMLNCDTFPYHHTLNLNLNLNLENALHYPMFLMNLSRNFP